MAKKGLVFFAWQIEFIYWNAHKKSKFVVMCWWRMKKEMLASILKKNYVNNKKSKTWKVGSLLQQQMGMRLSEALVVVVN